MSVVKKWRIQIVVLLTYLVLCILYFIENYTHLDRFPTIISLETGDIQLVCIGRDPKTFTLYSVFGHREEVNKKHLKTDKENEWLTGLLEREISQNEDIEIRFSESRHICRCRTLRNGRSFVYPYNSSLDLKTPEYERTWNSLLDISKLLSEHPAATDEGGVEELKKMACAYAGSPGFLSLTFTNDYAIAQAGDKVKVFKIDVKEYFERYGIEGYDDGEVMFYVTIAGYTVVVSSARQYAAGKAYPYTFPAKNESLLVKMSEEEYVSKKKDLLLMDYQKYASGDEFASFSKSLDDYLKSNIYNSFLNSLYESTRIKDEPSSVSEKAETD